MAVTPRNPSEVMGSNPSTAITPKNPMFGGINRSKSLPVATSDQIMFSGNLRNSRVARLAAVGVAVAALGVGVAGCADGGEELPSGVPITLNVDSQGVKTQNTFTVTPEQMVINNSQKVVGHFNEKGQALINDKVIARTDASGQIFAVTPDGEYKMGSVSKEGIVTDPSGDVIADLKDYVGYDFLDTPTEMGALAALTVFNPAATATPANYTPGSGQAGGNNDNDFLQTMLLYHLLFSNYGSGSAVTNNYYDRNYGNLDPKARDNVSTYTRDSKKGSSLVKDGKSTKPSASKSGGKSFPSAHVGGAGGNGGKVGG